MIDFILKNWRITALCAAAFLIAGFLFYLWAYNKGASDTEEKYAAANLVATETNAAANQSALGKELKATTERVRAHTETKRAIEDSTDAQADDPAPALDQLFYDRLRRTGGGKTD